ncbi:UDP-glucose 4-epimerase [Micromonospora sp. Llam0]|uniref:NAD-dependent epimerase/dehydratase family protein n=1 Tax=Micromonospora sp. Llam0 TaxID=2485143 RepID=UPI000F4A0076|nr:NAD-dependent epimerase/dehydratase family protein [Micromonospora sp. Llam0]ROO60617.1 UDP-glucose 4-epimerase [Micromonospora sp. Llam0]
MKVLVTGGAGFIGSHVVDALLAASHDVSVIDDLSTGRPENLDAARARGLAEKQFHRLDIAEPAAAALVRSLRPELIMLIGAQPGVNVSMRDPLLDVRCNVLGLVNLMEAAADAGVHKVVFASSGGTIYGDPPPGDPALTEESWGRPSSFYGLTKRVGCDYLRLYRRYRDIDYVALALGNVYGPRQDPNGEAGVVTIFANNLLRGADCTINGDGAVIRDYVHVSDVVDAFVRSMSRGHGLINVGTGIGTSVAGVYATVARHVGFDGAPRYGPALPGEVQRVRLCPDRAAERLGWRAHVSFDEGVADMIAYLRASAPVEPTLDRP